MAESKQEHRRGARRVRMAPLYRRLPHGPNGMSREDVARHQRARVVGGMIEAVHRRGYERTTVADVIELAGVSRRSFYEQFANREECFLAAQEVVFARARRRALEAWHGERGWERRMHAAWEAVLAGAARSPRGPRLALVGAAEAGPEAHGRVQLAELAFERLLAAGFAAAPGGTRVPALAPRAIAGGARRVLWRRLRDRRESELPGLTGELLDWAAAYLYSAPPCPAAAAPRVPAARDGYAARTEQRLVRPAGVCARGFRARSPGSAAAFLAAREELARRALAQAEARARGAEDWPHSVRLALTGFVEHVLSTEGLAGVLFVEPHAAGPAAAAQITAPVDELAALLLTGAPSPRRGPAVAAEALRGALWSLLSSRLPAGRPRRPEGLCEQLAFIVLAPYLGPRAALGAARARGVAA